MQQRSRNLALMIRGFLSASVVGMCCLGPAVAADQGAASSRLTPWRGGPVGNLAHASYCAVEAPFSNGITLSVGRSRHGNVTLAMMIPGLQPVQGSRWSVVLNVDGVTGNDKAQLLEVKPSGSLIAIPLGASSPIPQALFTGKVLTVSSEADLTSFDLDGVSSALDKLGDCSSSLRG